MISRHTGGAVPVSQTSADMSVQAYCRWPGCLVVQTKVSPTTAC